MPGVLLAATAALLALGVLDVVGAIAVAAATLLCVAWRKATPVGADPQRQARVELARARREDRGADVLVARLERASRAGARELASSLRLTDGVSVSRRGRAWELCAVISKENARAAIERRLAAAYGDRLRVSWARFPAEGVTLEALVERAREAAAPFRRRAAAAPLRLNGHLRVVRPSASVSVRQQAQTIQTMR